jgi:hypothetical protein
MNQTIFLLMLIILAIGLPLVFNFSSNIEANLHSIEAFSNYKLDQALGSIQEQILVQDIYPPIGKNQLSNDTSNDIWWHYPVFTLGSYKQITNNIRYPNNPDEGTCMPGSMCGALYHEKQTESNYIEPLPPVNECGTRIGYFTTNEQLVDSLPYISDGPNILY